MLSLGGESMPAAKALVLVLLLLGALLVLFWACKSGPMQYSVQQLSTAENAVSSNTKLTNNSQNTTDEKPIEYYFPALADPQNMEDELLYEAYHCMIKYTIFQNARVLDFDEIPLYQANWQTGWKVRLKTDRGEYVVVFNISGDFLSDNMNE